jgi:hypothetical protein
MLVIKLNNGEFDVEEIINISQPFTDQSVSNYKFDVALKD